MVVGQELFCTLRLRWQTQTTNFPSQPVYFEGIVAHGVDHILKEYLRGEGVSVVDDGLSIGAIPAVYFHTPAATTQSPEMTWANLIIHSLLFLLRSGSVKSKTNTVCLLIYLSYTTFSRTILLITVIK